MNIRKKIYSEYIGLRLTKAEHDSLCKKLCKRKEDKLSVKLREYIFQKLKEEPVIEYKITQEEGLTGVILYQQGKVIDTLFFDNIGSAMGHIKSIDAVKRPGKY